MIRKGFSSRQLAHGASPINSSSVTLFRTYRNLPSIFYISSFCNPFFCQRGNSKPRAMRPSSVQWECTSNDKTLPPIEHPPRAQKIHKNQPRLCLPREGLRLPPHPATPKSQLANRPPRCDCFCGLIAAPMCHPQLAERSRCVILSAP